MNKSRNRNCKLHKQWIKQILERDGNKCVECDATKKLVTHHIIPWNENIDLRFDINNGITLCIACHMKHHKNHKGKKQFNIWNKGIKTGIAPWKGKKFSKEHKAKLSKAKLGKTTWNKGLIGENSHMYGKSMSHKGKTWIINPDTGKRKWID